VRFMGSKEAHCAAFTHCHCLKLPPICTLLQERLARFMGSEEAILYSYDLATLPSIIPAFASKKDLILCDEVRFLLPACLWHWPQSVHWTPR